MTLEDELRVLLTTYPEGQFLIETLEISHSLFTQTFYFMRGRPGITATLETGQVVNFEPSDIDIQLNSTKSDLDEDFSFTLPDLDNILDDQLSLIPHSNKEKILAKYRVYINDDLTAPAQGPINLEALTISQEKGVFTISAGAPQLNWNKTGKIYDFETFPMMRAL